MSPCHDFYTTLFNRSIPSLWGRIIVQHHTLDYTGGKYDFLRISSSGINEGDSVMIIRAGVHGEEISGPRTLARYLKEIFDFADRYHVKLIIYILGNPSGFAQDPPTRYNVDGDTGSDNVGNNDFVRYRLRNGVLVDDFSGHDGEDDAEWYWSSAGLGIRLPKETKLMHDLLKQDMFLYEVAAALDLHQDYLTKDGDSPAPPAAYHYAYGDTSRYDVIVAEIARIVPVLSNVEIGAGQASPMKCNEKGFIVRRDGSFSDLMDHLSAPHSITVETMGSTPEDVADQVNLIWIFGTMKMITKKI